jgi:hypothetical protein
VSASSIFLGALSKAFGTTWSWEGRTWVHLYGVSRGKPQTSLKSNGRETYFSELVDLVHAEETKADISPGEVLVPVFLTVLGVHELLPRR